MNNDNDNVYGIEYCYNTLASRVSMNHGQSLSKNVDLKETARS